MTTDREEPDGSMTAEQLERASLIAESRGIDMETAQELIYLRDRAAVAAEQEDAHDERINQIRERQKQRSCDSDCQPGSSSTQAFNVIDDQMVKELRED